MLYYPIIHCRCNLSDYGIVNVFLLWSSNHLFSMSCRFCAEILKSKLEKRSMKEKGKYDDKVRSQRRRNRVVKVCIEQISLGMSRLSGSVAYLCIYIYCICRCIGFYVNKCSHLCVAKPYWC